MSAPNTIAPKAQDSWNKALSFIKAVGSVATHVGFVSQEVYEKRLASCRSCPRLDAGPAGEYCTACGCGRWQLARIDRKLYFPALDCPEGRAGFVNEGRPFAPGELVECKGCAMPDPDMSPFEIGERVVITVRLPNEAPDKGAWRVVARRGDVYEVERARCVFSWAWLWSFFRRRERAEIGRTALMKVY